MCVNYSPRRYALVLTLIALMVTAGFGQMMNPVRWAPVPVDANQPVLSGLRALTNPQERSSALQLLDRARQNYTFYGPHAPAFTLRLSFTSTGQSQYEGQGSMEETWIRSADRWSATIGSTQMLRVFYGRRPWSNDPGAPVPMRVQMARAALLWPVVNPPTRVMLRQATATIGDKTVSCILTSGGMANVEQPRHWVEKEYCVDPENGNLMLWSEAPGHYVFYDYTTATQFQGHVIANDISIYVAGNRVMQIHIDGIDDASAVTPQSLYPGEQLIAKGQSFGLSSPMEFPLVVRPRRGTVVSTIEPVFIHATINRAGHVIEAEALQNSDPDLTAGALDTVKSHNFGRSRAQREVFVDVEFLRADAQVASAP